MGGLSRISQSQSSLYNRQETSPTSRESTTTTSKGSVTGDSTSTDGRVKNQVDAKLGSIMTPEVAKDTVKSSGGDLKDSGQSLALDQRNPAEEAKPSQGQKSTNDVMRNLNAQKRGGRGESNMVDNYEDPEGSKHGQSKSGQGGEREGTVSRYNGGSMDWSGRLGIRKRSQRDHDDEEDERRRRKKAPAFNKPKVIQGATVAESKSQDMFIPSELDSVATISNAHTRSKSTIELLRDYQLNSQGAGIYNVVNANVDNKEKNCIGKNMQKALFNEIVKGLANIEDVYSQEYSLAVRNIIQGSMRSAKENYLDYKDIVKMLVSGLMAISPHDYDAESLGMVARTIAEELIYGKVNIGYGMKAISGHLGAAFFTLSIYYKNYQSEIEYTKQLEQKLLTAIHEGIWMATGEITNYSQSQGKANVDQFFIGRAEEEKSYQKSMVKGFVLSPFKKVFKS